MTESDIARALLCGRIAEGEYPEDLAFGCCFSASYMIDYATDSYINKEARHGRMCFLP